jgi:Concanavalin A-like lectin/glucanases superfamily
MTARLLSLSVAVALSATFQAAIVDVARFKLGEADSLVAPNNQPIDSLSTDTMIFSIAGGGTVMGSPVAPTSTAALTTGPGIQGFYGASGNGVFGASTLGATPDNFGVEIFVMPDLGQPDNIFFTATGTDLGGNNGLIFEIRNGNWAAAVPGNDWIRSVLGAGQPVTAGWTSLAVIRHSGVSTFYINGVPQPRTTTVAPSPPCLRPRSEV